MALMNFFLVIMASPSMLAIFAAAIPTSTATRSSTTSFALKSRPLCTDTAFASDLFLVPYHISPAYNYAVLSSVSSTNRAVVGYLNGTDAELAAEDGDLIFNLGIADQDIPFGFLINQVNLTYNPIEINAGNGTRGVFIDHRVIKFHSPLKGGFYGESQLVLTSSVL
ncbi:hypothetical protein ACLMJK_003322 [Lecanora helva]